MRGATMGSKIHQASVLLTNPKNENKNTAAKTKVSIYPNKDIIRSKHFYFFILVSLPLKKETYNKSQQIDQGCLNPNVDNYPKAPVIDPPTSQEIGQKSKHWAPYTIEPN